MSNARHSPPPYRAKRGSTFPCPHCWTAIAPEDLFYIARHPNLTGDSNLGPDVQSRFRANRFTPDGQAIDPGGYPCSETACPRCHLEVPASFAHCRPLSFSVFGTVMTGKSFFLASVVAGLRRQLEATFHVSFAEPDPQLNLKVHDYENALFYPPANRQHVSLPMTEEAGDLTNLVLLDRTATILPKPFLFAIRPVNQHPAAAGPVTRCRTLVLYDNSGVHFNPGRDTDAQPVTTHLARADVLFFLLDPTLDPRVRSRLIDVLGGPAAAAAVDPQLREDQPVRRQDVCFAEVARRIRARTGIALDAGHPKPIVVVVNKMDLWERLLSAPVGSEPVVSDVGRPTGAVALDQIGLTSLAVREFLSGLCPELLATIEDFATDVTYIPVSATGCSASIKENGLGVSAADLKPRWVTVPFLYALARLGLIASSDGDQPESEGNR
jgi:hypothetical protein